MALKYKPPSAAIIIVAVLVQFQSHGCDGAYHTIYRGQDPYEPASFNRY